MNIAVIENGVVSNVAVFFSLQSAQKLLPNSQLAVLEPGFGIGDLYIDGVFSHPQTEPEPEKNDFATYEELAAAIRKGVNAV